MRFALPLPCALTIAVVVAVDEHVLTTVSLTMLSHHPQPDTGTPSCSPYAAFHATPAYDYSYGYANLPSALPESSLIAFDASSPAPHHLGNLTRSGVDSPAPLILCDGGLHYPYDALPDTYSQSSIGTASTASAQAATSDVTLADAHSAIRPFSTLTAASTLLDLAASPSSSLMAPPKRVNSFPFSSPFQSLSSPHKVLRSGGSFRWSPYPSPRKRHSYAHSRSSSINDHANSSSLLPSLSPFPSRRHSRTESHALPGSQSTIHSSPATGLHDAPSSSLPISSSPSRYGFGSWDLDVSPHPLNATSPFASFSPHRHTRSPAKPSASTVATVEQSDTEAELDELEVHALIQSEDESEDEGLGSSIRDVYDTFKDIPSSDVEFVPSSGEEPDIYSSSPVRSSSASPRGTTNIGRELSITMPDEESTLSTHALRDYAQSSADASLMQPVLDHKDVWCTDVASSKTPITGARARDSIVSDSPMKIVAYDASSGPLRVTTVIPTIASKLRRSRRNIRSLTNNEKPTEASGSDAKAASQVVGAPALVKENASSRVANIALAAPPTLTSSNRKTSARTKKPRRNVIQRSRAHTSSIDSEPSGEPPGLALGFPVDEVAQRSVAKPVRKGKASRKVPGAVKRRKRTAAGNAAVSVNVLPEPSSVPSTSVLHQGSSHSQRSTLPVPVLPFPLIEQNKKGHSRLTSVVAALAARTGTGSLPRTPVKGDKVQAAVKALAQTEPKLPSLLASMRAAAESPTPAPQGRPHGFFVRSPRPAHGDISPVRSPETMAEKSEGAAEQTRFVPLQESKLHTAFSSDAKSQQHTPAKIIANSPHEQSVPSPAMLMYPPLFSPGGLRILASPLSSLSSLSGSPLSESPGRDATQARVQGQADTPTRLSPFHMSQAKATARPWPRVVSPGSRARGHDATGPSDGGPEKPSIGTLALDMRAYGRTPPRTRGQARGSTLKRSMQEVEMVERPTLRKRRRVVESSRPSPVLAPAARVLSHNAATSDRGTATAPFAGRGDDHQDHTQGPEADTEDVAWPERTLPLDVPRNPDFVRWYRRFAVPAVVDPERVKLTGPLAGASYNTPRCAWDLYTPRFVKGRGPTKVGLCPICAEPRSRGGEGKKVWLSMKFSAFKCYHMQYYHGLSTAGKPFSPPIAFRTIENAVSASKQEKPALTQGKCHRCKKWITVEGVKEVDVKVPEIYWWKHAASCHQGSTLDGECDVFLEDGVFEQALCAEAEPLTPATSNF